jgi:hypothetical protein
MKSNTNDRRKGDVVLERNLVYGLPEWIFALLFYVAYLLLLS